MKILIILLFCFNGLATATDITDEEDLRDAIISSNNAGSQPIFITIKTASNTLVISRALPPITGNLIIVGAAPNVILRSSSDYNGPLITVADHGRLILGNKSGAFSVLSFSNDLNGGAIVVEPTATFVSNGVRFSDTTSEQNGGAVFCDTDSDCSFYDTTFANCSAGASGGAVSCLGECNFNNTIFDGNSADNFACQIDAPFGSEVVVYECGMSDNDNNCDTNFIDVNGGNIDIHSCSITTDADSPFASCTGSCNLGNNLFPNVPSVPNTKNSLNNTKTVCNDFGTNAFNSLGYNIDAGSGCFLNHATDIENMDPMVTIGANGIPQPNAGSPLIESGSVDFVNNILPCSYKDLNGLGRPQDFDNDGVFTCDRGPVEVQSGADLTNAQSALYYDVDRSGEGVVVEMLSADIALVTMFTYHPNKTELMWFISVGKVVGNTLVFDQVLRTSGGVFGSSFDASAIVSTDVGGMSLIFSDCDSLDNEGRLIFDADFAFENELENLLVKNKRLSRLLNCDQSQPNALSGRSGSFYNPNRSGEGIFVQVLDNGSAVILFYTYTPDGKQTWLISSNVQITDNTITATMIYPATGTGFGSQFNGSELDFQTWGTLIFEYMPGCNQMNMSYDSSVAGFGSGTYTYNRLTRPAGLTCDL
jgi:hypothetical protein